MFPKEYIFEVSKDNHFVRYETVRGAFNDNAAGYVVDKRLQPGEVAALVRWEYVR
jgi:hypothetical protein